MHLLVCPGMGLLVDLSKPLLTGLGIHLSGGDIGMSQQTLDFTYIGAAAQQVRREGMAQRVRGYMSVNTHFLHVLFHYQPEPLAREPSAAMVEKKRCLPLVS